MHYGHTYLAVTMVLIHMTLNKVAAKNGNEKLAGAIKLMASKTCKGQLKENKKRRSSVSGGRMPTQTYLSCLATTF